MQRIDCRNMACPQPVVMVKRGLEAAAGAGVEVLLDDGAPRENVARFAANRGYSVEETPAAEGYLLRIGCSGGGEAMLEQPRGERVMVVANDRFGEGPEELGRLLLKNYLITLLDTELVPDRIFFLNSGVLLTTEGSELIEALEKLGNRGVEILSCGVCLDYFNRKDKLRAGVVTNMFTIAEATLTASNLIRV